MIKHDFNKLLLPIIASVMLMTGCSLNEKPSQLEATSQVEIETTTQTEPTESSEQLSKAYFDALNTGAFTLEDQINWLYTNLDQLSTDQASKVLMAFEEAHINTAFELMEKLYVKGSSEPVKSVSDEVLSLGYKLEPVEGSLNIIIDYGFYDPFLSNISEDVAAFYKLMKVESEEVPLKDAGIVITWHELFKRALSWETFTKQFPDSDLTDRAKDMLSGYLDWSFNGAPNSPVFDWDQNRLTDTYKQGIESFLSEAEQSSFVNEMRLFYQLIQKNDYTNNAEIESVQKKYLRVFD